MDPREGGLSEEEETLDEIYIITDDSEEDSEDDPCYDPLENARSSLSRISLNTSGHREAKSEIQAEDDLLACETGTALFEKVEKMIKDGKVDKLKVEECKVYLRRYSLRLSGNKSDLLARIKEHLELLGGGGLAKYPASSFTLNCKGDACMGDVVMFQQEGTVSRTVAGRIVKESYGTAKQQHTFTIEVLWSKGKNPLQVLYPLLIKGRNLYKLKTMRQAWPDEDERKKVLDEKHARGHAARCSRETRIREKELRIMTGARRCVPVRQESRNPGTENLLQVQAGGFPPIPKVLVHESASMPAHKVEFRSHGYRHGRPESAPPPPPPPSSSYHRHMVGFRSHGDHHGRSLNAPPPPPSSYRHHTVEFRSHGDRHDRPVNAPPPPPPPSSSYHAGRVSLRNNICLFHLERRCRYGNTCKNIHVERERESLISKYR